MAPSKRRNNSKGKSMKDTSLSLEPSDSKRQKLALNSKKSSLVDFITDYNLAVNELFQLKEYGSIVEWRPEDFATYNKDKPELYDHFLKENNIGLSWLDTEEDNQNLDDLPLRLQKKVLAEREQKILAKYPFKDEVLKDTVEEERGIIQSISGYNITPSPEPEKTKSPIKSETRVNKVKIENDVLESEEEEPERSPSKSFKSSKINVTVKDEFDPDALEIDIKESETEFTEVEYPSDLEDVDTHYKLKDVKFTIPSVKVTHPSHIPLWTPPKTENIQDEEEPPIIEFNPTPIEVISTKDHLEVAPQLGSKLQEFLENKFKTAIIDDAANLDYSNTMEEYQLVMQQQKEFFKLLHRKVSEEHSLELNGDKIEKRKLALPQTNAKIQADPFRNTSSINPKVAGLTSATHMDNLVAQGVSFSKIHQQVRKQRQLRVRKIATMVDQHFKWKRGEKERIEREREQNLKKISRIAIQAVKKRWTQANKVYKFLQDQRDEELKKIKGREHLSHMLEHSTQLLEAQLKRDESGDEGEDSENNSDNMSDSADSESIDDTMDDQLSVDKLKEKYSNIESTVSQTSVSAGSEDDDAEEEDDDDNDLPGGTSLAALYGGDIQKSENGHAEAKEDTEYDAEQLEIINKINEETSDHKMLDSDEESSIPDETTDDSSSESSGSEEEREVSEEEKGNGLLSLLSNDNNEEKDSDDESVLEDFNEDSDDDVLSSTDEEDEPKTPKSDNNDLNGKDKEINEVIVNGSKVRDVPVPSLLRGTLRPYQKQGLNWLASLYSNDTNGILADEMGLGKTIQTISLLSHLATEYHIWGPHLIIVPTSVMLNWEMEFKKFAPGFKVLTYYGSPQQRAQKRKGWNKPDAFHVCITSYQLVVHDHQSFKRRRWKYMILDEAHNIKNFRSTRWRALLNFNTENRLLLTGTPLQNNLMELWSLLYFLMPSSKVNQSMPDGFANLEDFQTWFGKPVDNILEKASHATGDLIDDNQSTVKGMDQETRNTVARLHQVLRPYILRRLKKDVEKQMPGKYEHIIYCRLSQRQRFLYDDFMSRAKTRETLASGNFLSIINCLMQLRKVCNHPDLFEVRPVTTSFAITKSVPGEFNLTSQIIKKLVDQKDIFKNVSFDVLNLNITSVEDMNYFVAQEINRLKSTNSIREQVTELDAVISTNDATKTDDVCLDYYIDLKRSQQMDVKLQLERAIYLNDLRCTKEPIYGESLIELLKSATSENKIPDNTLLAKLMVPLENRVEMLSETIENFAVLTPKAVAVDMKEMTFPVEVQDGVSNKIAENKLSNPFHKSQMKLSISFPDKSLLQYDCGKLQMLDRLLQQLTSGGHRALIFTQMTKVLDILEQFLNIHGYRYMRLDGATKIEDRQLLTEKFNRDPKIPVFILSSRSGGLGINLTGADTVIFYDSDWNPAMDKQCQDRCHRIGQVRDVHIYRFVSEHTIESNILRKANQKRQLDNVVIQEGDFTTDYFGKFSVRDLVTEGEAADLPDKPLLDGNIDENALMAAEDEDDRKAASAAMKETAVDDEDFNEEAASASQTPGPDKEKNRTGGDDMDYEEGVGHIDEYMLKFIANGYYD